MAHTPGPWLANSADAIYAVVNGTHEMIARACDLPCIDGHDDTAAMRAREQEKANARLIAAAPDLLAALENFVERYPNNVGVVDARAAINKARGQ